MALAFVERAERAVVDGEDMIADVLLAHAFDLDSSVKVRNHFLAHFYLKLGDTFRAKQHLAQLLVQQQEEASKYLSRPAGVDRLVLASTTRAAFDSWLIVTAKLGEHAYDAVLSSKALVARTALAERRIWRSIGREEPELFKAYQNARQRLPLVHGAPTLAEWSSQCDRAISDLVDARAALNARSGERHAQGLQWMSGTLTDIQLRLEQSEVVVDFVKYANRYAAWVVGQRSVARIELAPAQVVDTVVQEFRTTLGQRNHRYRELGGRLFELVWKPLEHHLAGAVTIYVVPDGSLVDCPLNALPTSHESEFVMDRWRIAYLLTAHEVLRPLDAAPRRDGILIVGVSETLRTLESERSMPWALPEVTALASLYPNPSVLVGESATERAFRDALSDKRILHLIAPTAQVPWSDRASEMLVLSADPGREIQKFLEMSDPLLKSGVAFYDHVMTALELSDLDLDGVDLVMLSMQEEGAIAWSGEGKFGIARGLVEAGARAVVSTSSLPDDRVTVKVMTTFHEQLRRGMSALDALRHAALTVRAANPHPYYWAQFTMHGDGRALPL
jgi:CHAT domain-containing protein